MSASREKIYVGTALATLGLWLVLILEGTGWRGSAELHTLAETVATVIALVVGVVSLLRFQTRRSNTVLFIGIGFFGTGFLDGYHAMVTSVWFVQLFPSSRPTLLFWSWNASRVFLSVLMFLSCWAWRREKRLGVAGQFGAKAILVIVGILCVASFCFFAFVPLPRAQYTEYVLRRPEEFVAGGFFLCALVGYLRKGAWAHDAFEHWIVLSLVVGALGQAAFMSLSFKLFDAMFDMAHVLKVASYFCVFTGLLVNTYEIFTRAERGASELVAANRSLREEVDHRERAEEKIRQLNSTLERRVEERGADLLAALESLRATEQQSRRQLAELETLYRTAPIGLALLDRDLRFLRINERLAQIHGVPVDRHLGRRLGELVPEMAEDGERGQRRVIETGEAVLDRELRGLTPGRPSERSYWQVSYYPLKSDDGAVVAVGAIVQDITARKHAEEEQERYAAKLTRANKDLQDFAYVASHDLRAPLRAIDNLAGWISEDAGDVLPERSLEHFRKMRQRVRRMEQLLDDLLQYSRAGHDEGDSEDVDTGLLLQSIVEFLDPPPGLSVSVAPDMPTLRTTKIPLEQVLRNLVGNAIKHHPGPRGRVQVSAREQEDFVEFVVKDDGAGIAPEYHGRIFEMFQTLQPRDEREATGMGLSIVKKLVENHGGSIDVDSSPGSGTTFRFTWMKEGAGSAIHA